MNDRLAALSEREKEALRLILWGHDAKSIARELKLSVHTVNERLRDARRKLGVSSSREAARQLGNAENWSPNLVGDKQIGVESDGLKVHVPGTKDRALAGGRAPWVLGGLLVMSLVIVAALLSSNFAGGNEPRPPVAPSIAAQEQAAPSKAAIRWLALVDAERWEQSWQSAGTLFKSKATPSTFAAAVRPVRTPLGKVLTRSASSFTRHSSLPGAPPGEYEIVEFKSDFANKKNIVERVVLAREGSAWKVIGYFFV